MSFLKVFDDLPDDGTRVGFFNQQLDDYRGRKTPKQKNRPAFGWHQMFRELREKRPVLQMSLPPRVKGAEPTQMFVFSRWHDVIDILRQDEIFTVRPYARAMDPSVGPFMLARDGVCPVRDEKSDMLSVLSSEDELTISAIAREASRSALQKTGGRIDLVKEVSRIVPVRVVQNYFGFPSSEDASSTLAQMLRWSRATQHDMFRNFTGDKKVHATNVRAGEDMRVHLRRSLGEILHGARPLGSDAVSRLIRRAQADRDFIELDRLVSNVCGFLVGAVETSSQAIVQIVDYLLREVPDAIEKETIEAANADDNRRLVPIVWETLRFNPVSTVLLRQVAKDYVLNSYSERYVIGDDDAGLKKQNRKRIAELKASHRRIIQGNEKTTIPKGSYVIAAIGSAMFDEEKFPRADEFLTSSPEREDCNYFHFGWGAHKCLGEISGRIIVTETVKQILQVDGLKLFPGEAGEINFGKPPKGRLKGPFPEKYVVGIK